VNVNASRPSVGVAGRLGFSAIAPGLIHSCGIADTGTAYCWGENSYGQLGDGSINRSAIPVAVSGSLRFGSLAIGDVHTCGLTRSGSGSAYCWGGNNWGQLGNGSVSGSLIPVAVSGGLIFRGLAPVRR